MDILFEIKLKEVVMEDLEMLLGKIRKEGIDQAEAEGAALIQRAREQADEIIRKAQDDAQKTLAQAKSEAEMLTSGGEATLKQAARDVLLSLEQNITDLILRTLAKEVDAALIDPTAIAALVATVVKAELKDGEAAKIVVPETILETVCAKLAKQPELTIITDHRMGTGFKVYRNAGRIEHDFSGVAVTDALGKLLRPQLAALLKQA